MPKELKHFFQKVKRSATNKLVGDEAQSTSRSIDQAAKATPPPVAALDALAADDTSSSSSDEDDEADWAEIQAKKGVPEFINYPLWARQIAQGSNVYNIRIHGVALLRSHASPGLLHKGASLLLGKLDDDEKLTEEEEKQRQKQVNDRLTWFFGSSVRARTITKVVLKLPGDTTKDIELKDEVTDKDGHYDLEFETELPGLKPGDAFSFEVHMPAGTDEDDKAGVGLGRGQVLGYNGLSIISDVDDTVKDTRVLEFKEMLKRAFIKNYHAIPDMDILYERLAARISKETSQDFATHFLSASPYAILPSLDAFFSASAFPPCLVQVANFSFKDLKSLKPDLQEYKASGTKTIIKEFPGRKFLLFGDSGQKDPEAYAQVVRDIQAASSDPTKWPECIVGIFIREVHGAAEILKDLNTAARYQTAFSGMDASKWRVFEQPLELEHLDLKNGQVWREGEENKYATAKVTEEEMENIRRQGLSLKHRKTEDWKNSVENAPDKAKRVFQGLKSYIKGDTPPPVPAVPAAVAVAVATDAKVSVKPVTTPDTNLPTAEVTEVKPATEVKPTECAPTPPSVPAPPVAPTPPAVPVTETKPTECAPVAPTETKQPPPAIAPKPTPKQDKVLPPLPSEEKIVTGRPVTLPDKNLPISTGTVGSATTATSATIEVASASATATSATITQTTTIKQETTITASSLEEKKC